MTRTELNPQILKYSVVAFATLVCGLNVVAATQLSFPSVIPALLPFTQSFYARARAASDEARGIDLARLATHAAPNRAENWLLLASAYQKKDKALSTRVVGALRTSYLVGALSPDAHDWRLEYVFSNWRLMPADIRSAAMEEAEAYVKRYAGRVYLKQIGPNIPDADGRVALGLVLLTAERKNDTASRVAEYRAAQSSMGGY